MNNFFNPARPSPEKSTVDLSVFDAQFATIQVPDRNEVPDGKYRVRVEDVKLIRGSNGCPLLKWNLLVLSGQFSGWHIFKSVVVTQATLSIIKSDLLVLGLKLAKLSELPQYLESLFGKNLEISKRTKGNFVNVYFLK